MDKRPMSAKEYFTQVFRLDERISCKLEQVMALRTLAMRTTSSVSDMPRSDSPNLQQTAALVCKIVDFENEINSAIDALIDLKREFLRIIDALPDSDHRELLEQRYLGNKTWAEIAAKMYYDERYIYKLHGKALLAAEPLIPAASRQRRAREDDA